MVGPILAISLLVWRLQLIGFRFCFLSGELLIMAIELPRLGGPMLDCVSGPRPPVLATHGTTAPSCVSGKGPVCLVVPGVRRGMCRATKRLPHASRYT